MALREILSKLGIDVDTKKLDQADGAINKAKEGLKTLVAAYAGFKAVGAVVGMTTDMANQADQLQKTANAFGVSARSLATWRFAAEQAGAETQHLDDAVKTFSSKAYDALTKGSEDSQKLLRKLGITMNDLKTQTADTLFDQAIVGFSKLKDGAQKTGLGLELFGGSAEKLFDQFNQGAEGINAAAAEFTELYGSNFDEHIRQSQSLASNTGKLDASFTAVKQTLGRALIPAMDWVVRHLITATRWFNRLASRTKIVEVGLIVLASVAAAVAVVIAVAFAPVILTILAIAAGIAVVSLVAEDLFVLFTGGKSAIGALIDKLFGIGTAQKVVRAVTRAAKGLMDIFRGMAGQQGLGVLGGIGFAIREVAIFIIDVFTTVAKVSYTVWAWIADQAKEVAKVLITVWKGAFSILETVVKHVVDAVTFVVNKLKDAVDLADRLAGGVNRFFNPAKVDIGAAKELEQTLNMRLRSGEDSGVTVRRSAREAPRSTTNNTTINVTAPDPAAAGAMVNRELKRSQERQNRAAYDGLNRSK